MTATSLMWYHHRFKESPQTFLELLFFKSQHKQIRRNQVTRSDENIILFSFHPFGLLFHHIPLFIIEFNY